MIGRENKTSTANLFWRLNFFKTDYEINIIKDIFILTCFFYDVL